MLLKLFHGQMKLIVKTELSTQTFAQTPKVMSYILQQKRHKYINYDFNRLANVCLLMSACECEGIFSVLASAMPPRRGASIARKRSGRSEGQATTVAASVDNLSVGDQVCSLYYPK